MSKSKYLTTPPLTEKMPPGVPYIIGNEFAERFSFYGMKAILVVFMTDYLMGAAGQADRMTPEEAQSYYHLFTGAVYFTPVLGALLADIFFGKYLTIMSLSLVYCAGHVVLAFDDTRMGLAIGLSLISLGAGGIKPCVSAHVGDQFGKLNQGMLQKVYGWFYLAINVGSFLSMVITPVLLREKGGFYAFGLPGVLMFLATWIFWLGRNKFVHIPAGGSRFLQESFTGDGLKIVGKIFVVLVFTTPFWALFDQTGSSWINQAKFHMDLSFHMDLGFLGKSVLPSQIQSVNPFFIIVLIPLLSYVVYPRVDKVFKLTAVRKIGIGFFMATIAFSIPAVCEIWIADSYEIIQEPRNGKILGSRPNLVYEPNAGFTGEDRLTFRVRDGDRVSEPATVTIRVAPEGELLDAGEQELNTDSGTSLAVLLTSYSTIPSGEGDEGLASVSYELIGLEKETDSDREVYHTTNGTITGSAPNFFYTSNDGFTGTERFRFRATAGDVQSKEAEIAIVVDRREDPPVAGSRTVTAIAGGSVRIALNGGGMKPSFLWQVLALFILTLAEIMISVTALEFAYTQAPKTMKSFIMFFYLLPMALGNWFTALVNFFIQNEDGTSKLAGPAYFWFFDGLIFATGILFLPVVFLYKGKTIIQGDEEGGPGSASNSDSP